MEEWREEDSPLDFFRGLATALAIMTAFYAAIVLLIVLL